MSSQSLVLLFFDLALYIVLVCVVEGCDQVAGCDRVELLACAPMTKMAYYTLFIFIFWLEKTKQRC